MTDSRSIHITTNDPIFLLCVAESYSIVYMHHIFIHSSVDEHLGCFRVLTIVNNNLQPWHVRTHTIMKHGASWLRGERPRASQTHCVSWYHWTVGPSWFTTFHSWFFLITFLSSSFLLGSHLPFPFSSSSSQPHIFDDFEAGMAWVPNTGQL